MYVSRLKIKNYRSIKELDLEFKKGKNVIVGKNNAGKSNIVQAIDLLLGESSPTYHKTQNINDNDFHCRDTDQPIYIYCELTREQVSPLAYAEFYKGFGLKRHSQRYNYDTPEYHTINPTNFWLDIEKLFQIDDNDNTTGTKYLNPKKPENRDFEKEFTNKCHFAIVFKAYVDNNGNILKELRFIYRENETTDWCMAFWSYLHKGENLPTITIDTYSYVGIHQSNDKKVK